MTLTISQNNVGPVSTLTLNAGPAGKSAYQSWLALGNTGSEQDFIDSLSGGGAAVTSVSGKVGAVNLVQSDIGGLVSALEGKADTSHAHATASSSTAGFMSNTDKLKLDGLSNYTLPVAGLSTLGGVKRNTGGAGQYVSGIDSAGNLLYTTPAGGGGGTVTSVGLTVPTGLSVSGSPITSTGTFAITLAGGYVIPLQSTIDNKVDKVTGKGLSTEDFSTAFRDKLFGLESIPNSAVAANDTLVMRTATGGVVGRSLQIWNDESGTVKHTLAGTFGGGDRTHTFADKSGTVAHVSDITAALGDIEAALIAING